MSASSAPPGLWIPFRNPIEIFSYTDETGIDYDLAIVDVMSTFMCVNPSWMRHLIGMPAAHSLSTLA